MILYDHRGAPIDPSELVAPHDDRPVRSRSNAWEQITGHLPITPRYVAESLRRAENGDVEALMLLGERMEERLPAYAAALSQRKQAVIGSPWRVQPASSSSLDQQIAGEVEAFIDSDAFRLWLIHLLDAVGKGYSVGEMIWADGEDGLLTPSRWRRVRPQDILFDRRDGETAYLRIGRSTTLPREVGGETRDLEPLMAKPGRWVTHCHQARSALPVNGGLAKGVAYLYLFWTQTMTRWASFMEVYGMPWIIGKHPPGALAEHKSALMRAMVALGQNARVTMSDDMKIEPLRAPMSGLAGSDSHFREKLEYLDAQIAIMVSSQTMTQQDGSSLAQAEVHDRQLRTLIRSDAFQASATVRRDIVRAYVDLNYGAMTPAPFVGIDAEEGADLKLLAEFLAPMVDRGLPIGVAWLLKHAGIPVPEGVDETMALAPQSTAVDAANGRAADATARAERLARALIQLDAEAPGMRDKRSMCTALNRLVKQECAGFKVEILREGDERASWR